MKQEFLKGKTGTIRLTVYENNRPIVPTTAKVTLYTPSGGVLQAQADGSVDATTGEMTYSLTTIHTADNKTNYKAVWEYVYNTVTYYETQLFDVVNSILSIPITDDDLYRELDTLRSQNYQRQGTADSGTASTLVDTEMKEESDFWTGGTLEILSGTGSVQVREITDFVQSTSTFTVSPNFATNPDTTSIYKVTRSFTKKIQQSFDELSTMIYNKGNRAALILESSQVKFPLIYLTLSKICRDFADEVEDKWDRLSVTYKEMFDNAFTNMKLEYDEDESGSITGDEEGRNMNVIRTFRG